MKVCLLLLVALALAACEPTIEGSASDSMLSPVMNPGPSYALSTIPTSEARNQPDGSEEILRERHLVIDEVVEATQAVSLILHSEASLQEKDRAIRQALQQPLSEEVLWLAEQKLSLAMLEQLLQVPDANPELIGFYAEKLIQRNNPNADLILSGLERVKEHWSEDRIANMAHLSQEAALDYLARSCPACEQITTFSEIDADQKARLDGRSAAIVDALPALQRLAQ